MVGLCFPSSTKLLARRLNAVAVVPALGVLHALGEKRTEAGALANERVFTELTLPHQMYGSVKAANPGFDFIDGACRNANHGININSYVQRVSPVVVTEG